MFRKPDGNLSQENGGTETRGGCGALPAGQRSAQALGLIWEGGLRAFICASHRVVRAKPAYPFYGVRGGQAR
ncbi:MAG: hypothetical protein DBY36_08245 [Clostridiales bacterium]|nr:MAG: hypothetical protein DBY36_08245 [Clostridiales bacterium]